MRSQVNRHGENINDFGFRKMNEFKNEIIYNGLTKNRIIHIWSEIDDDVELVVVHSLSKMCKPDKNGNKLPITIRINTLGGDVLAALSICDAIESAKSNGYKVITEGYSKIFSAGVPIYLVGSERKCFKNSRFLVHDGSVFMMGTMTGEESKRLSKSMEEVSIPYEEIVTSKSKITKEQMKKYNSRIEDWEFWGKDSIKLGMTDKLL